MTTRGQTQEHPGCEVPDAPGIPDFKSAVSTYSTSATAKTAQAARTQAVNSTTMSALRTSLGSFYDAQVIAWNEQYQKIEDSPCPLPRVPNK